MLLFWATANVVVVALLGAAEWSRVFYAIGRRSPIVIRTRKQDGARLRHMFDFGREAERVCPSPPPEDAPTKRRHLSLV
jgi:hypothetical protein